jgi:hypothetical protein
MATLLRHCLEQVEKKRSANSEYVRYHGITHLIKYLKIDSPMDALTLTHEYHQLFGVFKIYFKHTGNPYKYRIQSTKPKSF